MYVINARNVNDAYLKGLALLRHAGDAGTSRNGPVLVSPRPVTTVYDNPQERVLFNARRDANPFFHLFESLWILGGRNDSAYLDQFVHDFGSRYAEAGGQMYGAYGYRLRSGWDVDQLTAAVQRLQRDPNDRRVVLTMWDPSLDVWAPEVELDERGRPQLAWLEEPKDLPCNLMILPRVRKNHLTRGGEPTYDTVLDITVVCRSNDIVWGAYGANAVHFSVLQEYLAARIGVEVGTMYQVSNNWHGYVNVLNKVQDAGDQERDPYLGGTPLALVRPAPMFEVPSEIDNDLHRWFTNPHDSIFGNPWFNETAGPMLKVHEEFKAGDYGTAVTIADAIDAPDWRLAVQRWLARREPKAVTTAGYVPEVK